MNQRDLDWHDFLIYRDTHDLDDCEQCEGMGYLSVPFAWLLAWPDDRPECPGCLGTGRAWPGRDVVHAALLCLPVGAHGEPEIVGIPI